jgi:hypothetical protein
MTEVIMKLSYVFLIITLTLGGISFVSAQPAAKTISVRIHAKKDVSGYGLRIRFIELLDDSRCPTDTTCVWAGNAKVRIDVRSVGGNTRTFELNTALEPNVVKFGDYEIRLADVTPHPRSNISINRNGYVAKFVIRRIGK